MGMSTGRMSQIKTGYQSVYGKGKVLDKTIISKGENIIFATMRYPFETENSTSFRLSKIQDLGDTVNIKLWIDRINDSEFSNLKTTTYGKLFDIGKKYPISGLKEEPIVKEETVEETTEEIVSEITEDVVTETEVEVDNEVDSVVQPIEAEIEVPVTTVGSNIIINKNIGGHVMEHMNAIERLAAEAANAGLGSLTNSNVSEVTKNDKLAAKKIVESSQADRINYSKEAKVEKVAVVSIDREKKATKGRAAMGKVSNPVKAFETFVTKTGCSVTDGEVKFSKLHSSQLHDDAVAMYNILLQAKDNPGLEVEPFFGKADAATPISIKGVILQDPSQAEILLPQKDLAGHILQNAFLYLNVDGKSGAQFQLDSATPRGGQAPKRSYVVRVANKSALLEDTDVIVSVKNIQTKISEAKSGFKSALSVSCITNFIDTKGNAKKITWRIPLEVEQFEVEIVDKYQDLFKAGIGNTVKLISVDNAADVESIVEKITALVAAESTKHSAGGNILGSSITAMFADEKTKIISEAASGINQTLGAEQTENQFDL